MDGQIDTTSPFYILRTFCRKHIKLSFLDLFKECKVKILIH